MFNSFQISDVNATDAKNNNPMLKAIKINGIDIEPTFDMLTTEYVVNVDNNFAYLFHFQLLHLFQKHFFLPLNFYLLLHLLQL